MTNQRSVTLIICFMGTMGLSAIAAAVYLASVHQPIPTPLWGITGGAMVGLPSLLASLRTSSSANDPPAPVQVMNDGPAEAIPTETTKPKR